MNDAPLAHSPDTNASGLVETQLDPARYDWDGVFGPDDVCEVPAIVAGWLPEGARILDVGCASGAMTVLITRGRSGVVLGVEPDAIRSEVARSRGLNVVTGLMDEAFLSEHGPFDVILFTDVLEHMLSPGDILAIAAKGLAPGGRIIASVPNVAHWTVRLRLLFGRFDYAEMGIMDATHLRWFTRKSFRALFERQGFSVVGFSASAGYWLSEYRRLPFRLLPGRLRRPFVQFLVRTFPGLFGCQHIISALAPAVKSPC